MSNRMERRSFLAMSSCALCGVLLGTAARGQDRAPGTGAAQERRAVRRASDLSPASPHVREAYWYERLEDGRIHCTTCPHECRLPPGATGLCRSKVNLDGRHYTFAYGNPCAVHVDPVEKKPMMHFLPSTLTFSLAAAGCNMRCLNCQNWEISQASPLETRNYDLPPDQVVAAARRYNCPSISYTYSEPNAYYEYAVDIAELARAQGVRSVWVSAAYINPEPLARVANTIHGASMNLKAFDDRIYRELNGASLQPVLDTLVSLKQAGVWLEVINLIVPTWTDDFEMIRRMCGWFVESLGPDTPLHFSRFTPRYKLVHLPQTPEDVLSQARDIARDAGIRHVYVGNVPGLAENTLCHSCGRVVIERRGFRILRNSLKDGCCDACGEAIAGVWS